LGQECDFSSPEAAQRGQKTKGALIEAKKTKEEMKATWITEEITLNAVEDQLFFNEKEEIHLQEGVHINTLTTAGRSGFLLRL
jgi:hypothetical protein